MSYESFSDFRFDFGCQYPVFFPNFLKGPNIPLLSILEVGMLKKRKGNDVLLMFLFGDFKFDLGRLL